MSDRDVLEEISETALDPGLKATAIRDRIRSILLDAGYAGEEDRDEDEDQDEEDRDADEDE